MPLIPPAHTGDIVAFRRNVPPGMVQLDPSRGPAVVITLNKEPDVTLGVGGWQASQRQLRRSARWWSEIPDDTIVFDAFFDVDAHAGPSIETRIGNLQQMGLPGDRDEPPTIKLYGDVWDRLKTFRWVVSENGITLGPRLWLPNGSLRRQQVGVTLERHEPLDEIEAIKIKSTRNKSGRRRRHTIKTKAGDTLRAVALRELGSATRWKDLRDWNKKRLHNVDPDVRLRTGTHLIVR